jgi:hypothetical protein
MARRMKKTPAMISLKEALGRREVGNPRKTREALVDGSTGCRRRHADCRATASAHRDDEDVRRISGAADLRSDRGGIIEAREELLHPHERGRLLQTSDEIGARMRTRTCDEGDGSVPATVTPACCIEVYSRRSQRLELVEELLAQPSMNLTCGEAAG